MTKNIFIFLGTFIAGAVIALAARAAMFKPHAGHEGHPAGGGDYAAMVSNPLVPSKSQAEAAPAEAAATGHEHPPAAQPQASNARAKPAGDPSLPVNTVCAICGMKVDPKLPTAEYKGQTIGFGCKMCAPKLKANPDRYGPYYLRNEVIK